MKRILFKRVLIIYLIFIPIFGFSLERYLSSTIRDNYIKELRKNLLIQSDLIADKIPSTYVSNLDEFCKFYKGKTGARITIVDSTGKVIGDSDEPSGKMGNHLNRPEIQDADLSGSGSSVRFSKTMAKDLFYLAVAVDQGNGKKFLRLSIPLHDVKFAINSIRIRIVLGSLGALFLVIIIGLLQTRKITKSLAEIAAFSKDVAEGNYQKKLVIKEKGEFGELTKNINDMAEQIHLRLKQTEEDKQKIEAILMNISDGLILSDTKGTITMSNVAMKNLFELKSSIEGKTLVETFRNTILTEIVDDVVENGVRISREMEISYPKQLFLIVAASPFFSYTPEKELSGVVLSFHDITRLKKLEDIRKDFVANVSHEIKTPITAIKGFAETLLDGALDDKENAFTFLNTIKNHSERLSTLVSDLLTLSRIELGDIIIEKTTVNLVEIIDTVFATLKEKVEGKGISLKRQIAPVMEEIQADKNRLIQIFLNLVDNAIKFTEHGEIKILADQQKIDNEQTIAMISVEDTGIGIPKKHLDRLGERFYRVDTTRSRELGGTGLGLAIVKHLVKAHGWEMKIESTEGKGTIVKIVWPLN